MAITLLGSGVLKPLTAANVYLKINKEEQEVG
jgi:hypothetical protein